MKKGMAPIVIGVIVLVGLLFGLGLWQSKSSSSGDNSSQQSNQQSNQQTSQNSSSSDAVKPVANLSGDLVTSLVPMQTIGNPATAKTRVTVGYAFDTRTQVQPEAAAGVVDGLRDWVQKHSTTASFQLVCEDLPADQFTGANAAYAKIPLGITINGKQPPGFNANPGEGTYTKDAVLKVLGGP